jgi:hypothetical protein
MGQRIRSVWGAPGRWLGALLGALVLAGCGGAMSEGQCRKGEWYAHGTKDGLHGRPSSVIGDYAKACAEYHIHPDVEAWETGHREGLDRYCTDGHGYDAGRLASTYENACAERPEAEAAFFTGYRRGLVDRLHRLQDDARTMSDRLAPITVSHAEADETARRAYMLQFDLSRAAWLLAQVDARQPRGGAPVATGSPGLGEEVLLAHLLADDPEIAAAARAIAAGGDVAARRAASARLVMAAQTLTSARWREQHRARLRSGGAAAEQIEVQLDRMRNEQLGVTLAAMRAIGGPKVVAYCFGLAEDEYAPLGLRQAALSVLGQHVDGGDAAGRARGAALWERVEAKRVAEEAVSTGPR